MVRLKLAEVTATLQRVESFQFHNGSIKARQKTYDKSVYKKFQFHNGSIKAKPRSATPRQGMRVSIPQWFD